ncbi:MAG: tetratricopeptide repeat protein [bacterium]|nr:tetratricopeptide repeat protein [bacterium]
MNRLIEQEEGPFLPHNTEYAQRLLRELDLPGNAEQILENPKYADPGFAAAFYEHCEEVLFHSPEDALKLAKVALRLAHSLPEGTGPEGKRKHLELFVKACWIVGSAYRKFGRTNEAEGPYRKALGIAGISDAIKAALYLRLAILRVSQQRYEDALKLIDQAERIYRSEKDSKGLGHAFATRGYTYNESGRFAEAISQFTRALSAIDPHLDPESGRFHYSATHNVGFAISQCRSPEAIGAAQIHIREARRLLGDRRRSVPRYKLYWYRRESPDQARINAVGRTSFTPRTQGTPHPPRDLRICSCVS